MAKTGSTRCSKESRGSAVECADMTMIEQRPQSGSSQDADAAIVFPDGLVGCPDWKRFTLLVDDEEDMPVALLKSLDFPDVELLVTDPRILVSDFGENVGIEQTAAL